MWSVGSFSETSLSISLTLRNESNETPTVGDGRREHGTRLDGDARGEGTTQGSGAMTGSSALRLLSVSATPVSLSLTHSLVIHCWLK